MDAGKRQVHDFWNAAACGEELYLRGEGRRAYEDQARKRYELEPYIADFARFADAKGSEVLEIGVGLGADHEQLAKAGARLHGIDLTQRAVDHTRNRLAEFGLSSELSVGDAEYLAFPDDSFDLVYSWGVLHHSPDTPRAIAEVHRVLRPGGTARVMIYHKWSLIGAMLWLRYALLRLRPWTTLAQLYSRHLESPGTKAYSRAQARALFAAFKDVRIRTVLTHGDLLDSGAGQRHSGPLLAIGRKVWPRGLLRKYFQGNGLFMLIEARK